MIIDFHTHCFPDKIAERAIKSLSDAAALKAYTDGTLMSLRTLEHSQGVDYFVVNNIATNPRQQRNVNDFAASINGGDVIAFGSVFPFADDALDEIDRIAALGLKGIKLHPEYQGFYVDDPRLGPIYEKIAENNLILTFHAGADLGFKGPYHATPERFARVVDSFRMPVVLAHWGGSMMHEDVIKFLVGKDVYFDLSFGYGYIPPVYAKEIIAEHGADRLLFGTDCPWHTPEQEMFLLKNVELSEYDKNLIFSINAQKLLNVDLLQVLQYNEIGNEPVIY